jgi:hypothetical protein
MDDKVTIDAFESALVDLCNEWGSKGVSNTAVYKSLIFVANLGFIHKMYMIENKKLVGKKK